MRPLKRLAKRALRAFFELGQRAGVDVLPRHFYSEVPCIRELRATRAWRRAYDMSRVTGADVEAQFAFVASVLGTAPARDVRVWKDACRANGAEGYGPVEARFLDAYVRASRPPRIVQVGCGVSTAVLLAAAAEAGYAPRVECVEPYPGSFLETAARDGRIELVRARAEDVPLERYRSLGPGELLFVDSTHTLRPGGDVPRLVLEVLPHLRAGVRAHFHDVFFPYDYGRGILDEDLFFPHESVLLQAYLTQNADVALRASFSMLHYAAPSRLASLFPGYRPEPGEHGLRGGRGDFPSSLYLEVMR